MVPALPPLATLSQLRLSPSQQDAIPPDLEEDLRAYGCKLIHQAGILLAQKQVAVATAQILFQRFWYVSSLKNFGVADIGMGALYLASKLEECPIRMRDLINVYDVLLQRAAHSISPKADTPFKYYPMSYFGTSFYDLKEALVVAEMQVLKRLGFDVHVVLPYGTLVNYLQVLGLIKHGTACTRAWGYLNDAFQTPVYALYQVPTIVCAAILLTVRHLGLSLPSEAPHCWWELFDAAWEDMWSVCGYIMRLYRERGAEERRRVLGLVAKKDVRRWLDSRSRGLVLWSRSFTPAAAQLASSPVSPVNSLIRDALIEGRTTDEKYEKDGYAVKWTFVNDLELIFVVAYQRILQLTYVDELLLALKTLFVKYYEPVIATFVASLHTLNSAKATALEPTTWNFAKLFEKWDSTFDSVLRSLEDKDRRSRGRAIIRSAPVPVETPSSDDQSTDPTVDVDTPKDEQQIARNLQTLKNRLRGRGGRRGARGGRQVMMEGFGGRESQSNSESEAPTKRKNKTKVGRTWGDSHPTEQDMEALDYSADRPIDGSGRVTEDVQTLVDQSSLGSRNRDGLYEVKDWEFSKDHNDVLAKVIESKPDPSSSLGTFGSLIARLTGSKVLTQADLKPILDGMEQHLMKKNVAKEIAEKICESVGENLVGRKVGGFETTNAAVRKALSTSITRILTPKTSTDLLLSIRTKLSSPLPSTQQRMPYSITFVGVNGVGKSTNLSKVCFWLIQNGLRVLIAACDTFRSGAVEQLRVHVRNLSMLGVNGAGDSKGRVELYEKGYGKDAAAIAKEAITYARDNDFDVVLIDTAGRMQDNEPLMRALAKLVATNNPDKIIFVGEALVGNEAVDQLTKFDRALRDFSSASGVGKGRGIDGMLVTKWDTVDDKVGAALSMTYVTGQPIIFVGCGQTYTDLRQLKVANVVQAILSE
ncbi:hypothetical protein AGABI1DRAFT_89509 [Agaricus bisporus var. burnettii JB137-S8]|uniref:SRP54-type proteins GTP-binding domain-containing protein n=1 Tax=Agaricus bisporus var. burnettii (strain JB137-S8 / ATCC MYA-4627 / FGSC 10392) TaxID=597362 RepID=K5W7J3_AGABU|nr:uncharacterized protein AGABI1DRAFT_89509 [Agaricus bisporus var. burnettii JB137-S8]EKM82819.1 hypothetical protein AGABI1DRAFT_89509 [Agaricus bisporus var. burnettii JB137-S8]